MPPPELPSRPPPPTYARPPSRTDWRRRDALSRTRDDTLLVDVRVTAGMIPVGGRTACVRVTSETRKSVWLFGRRRWRSVVLSLSRVLSFHLKRRVRLWQRLLPVTFSRNRVARIKHALEKSASRLLAVTKIRFPSVRLVEQTARLVIRVFFFFQILSFSDRSERLSRVCGPRLNPWSLSGPQILFRLLSALLLRFYIFF